MRKIRADMSIVLNVDISISYALVSADIDALDCAVR